MFHVSYFYRFHSKVISWLKSKEVKIRLPCVQFSLISLIGKLKKYCLHWQITTTKIGRNHIFFFWGAAPKFTNSIYPANNFWLVISQPAWTVDWFAGYWLIGSMNSRHNRLHNFLRKFLQQPFAAANKLWEWSTAAAKHGIQ